MKVDAWVVAEWDDYNFYKQFPQFPLNVKNGIYQKKEIFKTIMKLESFKTFEMQRDRNRAVSKQKVMSTRK